jgi:S-adenosyl-L-methionine hydrolase (adenosine-forming)
MKKANGFITIMTDFGLTDGFVGAMKGVIYSINPKAIITDITHDINPYNMLGASFIFNSAYKYFPKGTVHLVVVDPGVGSERRALAIETEDYFFVTPDNGVLSSAIENEKVIKIIELSEPKYFRSEVSNTFHGRDIFAPISANLSLGVDIDFFGNRLNDIVRIFSPEPQIAEDKMIGEIIYIDRFGNLITNISMELIRKLANDKEIVIKVGNRTIYKISNSYADVPIGKLLAIFNSFEKLEIALNSASASKILSLQKGDPVIIQISGE